MANLNKVMLIGRLTRDPETRTFSNGGKVSKFGFAVNNRKRNQATGEWEDEPVFIDVDAFNRGDFGKLGDRVEQHLRKGQQVFIEGHLRMDTWDAPDGQKRSKLLVIMDNFQYLDPKDGGTAGSGGGMSRSATPSETPTENYPALNGDGYGESSAPMDRAPAHNEDNIPF